MLARTVFDAIADRFEGRAADIAGFVQTGYSFEEWLNWEAFAACHQRNSRNAGQDYWALYWMPPLRIFLVMEPSNFPNFLEWPTMPVGRSRLNRLLDWERDASWKPFMKVERHPMLLRLRQVRSRMRFFGSWTTNRLLKLRRRTCSSDLANWFKKTTLSCRVTGRSRQRLCLLPSGGWPQILGARDWMSQFFRERQPVG